jgi:diguanylate cyclase with GGDEF domain/PucR-like helix-turn-helix protein
MVGNGGSTGLSAKPQGDARPFGLARSIPGDTAAHEENGPLPANGGESLGPARIELTSRLRSRQVELQEAVFAHVRSVAPDAITDEDAQLALGLREMIAVCVDFGLASIERGEQWPGPAPPAVAAQARRAASHGMSLATALRRCAAGSTLLWSFVLGEVARQDLPEEQRYALLLQASAVMGSLLVCVQAEIGDAHSLEIRRGARSHEQRRAETVHKLLAGEPADAGELADLGYELEAWHLGVIATGAEAGKAVRGVAAALGRKLLSVAHGRETVWAWLGGQRQLAFADVERVLRAQEDTDVSFAIGEPRRGADGWRQTHGEAEGALLVARCRPCKLTRYRDVAQEAAALQDEAFADSMIDTYLSPLDEMRIGGQAARKTLRALFQTGHNVSSAASALKVDRSTVHRQRNEIEQRLGCQLRMRQGEIEVALRIEDLRRQRDARMAAHVTG